MADLVITPANFIPSAKARYARGLACGTVAVVAGDILYKHPTTKKLEKGRANAAGTITGTGQPKGMAAHAAAPNQQIAVLVYDPELALGAAAAVEGQILAVSAAVAGATCPSEDLANPNYLFAFGIVKESGKAYVDFEHPLQTNSVLPVIE